MRNLIIAIFTVFTMILLTLKLIGEIDIHWFWVLSPMIIPGGFILIAILFTSIHFKIRTKKWRCNIRVGDKCYFYNILGGITVCTVEDIKSEKNKVFVTTKGIGSYSVRWADINELYPYEIS
ncbi:MAG: hypothetical protein ACOC1X_04160 [Promethearchaeota archaeon]